MEELVKPQGQDLVRLEAHHLGKSGVGEQDAAVLPDREDGNGNPLQHDQGR